MTTAEETPAARLLPGRLAAPPGEAGPTCRLTVPASWWLPDSTSAPSLARNFVRTTACLGHLASPDDALLLAVELVTNARIHGIPPVRVSCRCVRTAVIFCVADAGQHQPSMVASMPAADAESGRGLALLDALSMDWGIHPHPRGKTVWFVLASRE